MRTDYKSIFWNSLHPGDELTSIKYKTTSKLARWEVISANATCVVLLNKYTNEEEIYYSSDFSAYVPYTDEELRERYHRSAREVVKQLQNTVYYDAIGYHEMWNGWIGTDAYEFAQALEYENIKIIGVCYDIPEKNGLIDTFDIGIVCEYEDGERFWCHYKSEWLKDIFDDWGVKY